MKYSPMPIKVKPYAHQRDAYKRALEMFLSGKSRGYGLLFECGCGKTITAIAVACQLYLTQEVHRVLILAPLSILSVWKDEFEKFAGIPYALAILEGSGAKKTDTLRRLRSNVLTVAVVNYESAWRLESELLAWKPDMIIADEAHRLKTHNSKQSKACHRLSAAAKYRLILTGTLVTNHAEDVFSPYKFLNPAIFGNSYYAFRNRFFDTYGYGNHQYRLKKSMEPEYTKKLHSIAYRIKKEDALDLPDTTDIIRRVTLEPNAAKLYAALVKECYAELENGEISVTNVLTKILRLSQLTGGFITDDDGKSSAVSNAKLDCLSDLLETLREENKKAVVIAKFTAEINAIKAMLEKAGVLYSAVTGETKDRAEQTRRFQQETEVSVFIGQIACASVGLTLHAASDLIFYSLDYSTANHEQARSRIHRAGQTRFCSYYYIQARGTIDEKVLRSLKEKSDFARRVTDEYKRGVNPF